MPSDAADEIRVFEIRNFAKLRVSCRRDSETLTRAAAALGRHGRVRKKTLRDLLAAAREAQRVADACLASEARLRAEREHEEARRAQVAQMAPDGAER